MPVPIGTKQSKSEIARLKQEYLDFYQDCPIQKLAAQYIMRDTDTITIWKKNDQSFSDKIHQAEAKFARKNLLRTNADWKLTRLMAEYFKDPDQNINVTVLPILGGLTNKDAEDKGIDQGV